MIKYIIFVIIFLISIAAIVSIPICLISKYQCEAYQRNTGRETKFKDGECYVNHDDTWYTYDEFRYKLLK